MLHTVETTLAVDIKRTYFHHLRLLFPKDCVVGQDVDEKPARGTMMRGTEERNEKGGDREGGGGTGRREGGGEGEVSVGERRDGLDLCVVVRSEMYVLSLPHPYSRRK